MFRPGVILLSAALAFAGCKGGTQPSADMSAKAVDEILAADRAFNDMAREKGEQAAYAAYMDPTMGMQMDPGGEPAKGTDAIKALHSPAVPSLVTWQVAEAYAAKSGDFGMSWGHWKFAGVPGMAPFTGKYVIVWHKTADGSWKGLMDTGVLDTPAKAPALAPATPPVTASPSTPPTTPNFAPTAPPQTNPSQSAPPDITPSTVPQKNEPHSSPENPH